ncbi:MAG: response regulator [Candidatus Omnitrophota bacterium]
MEDRKTNILIIDDEEDAVYCLKNFLARKGYATDSATSGEEALEKLSKKNADLILLDIVMPGLNGTEIAKIVREKYPNIKIIVTTAFPKESKVLSKGGLMEALITKPFRIQELYEKLDEVINHPEAIDKEKINAAAELETKILFVKAKILFVTPAVETYEFLQKEFEELARYGQYYDLDLATDENELSKKIKLSPPDIVIFEESYLDTLNADVPANILLTSKKISEVSSFELNSAAKDPNSLDKLYRFIRDLCIKNSLVAIR